MTEHEMYMQIADYMRYQYPKVIYRFDLAADLKLSIGQAKKHKRLQGRRGYPDLFIAEPRNVKAKCKVIANRGVIKEAHFLYQKYGLFIELKRPDVKIYKKNGELVANEHIREQAALLEELRQRGYVAEFACGFDEAKKIIDEYLGGPAKEEVEF